jgi:6-phosphofructokinase 1
MPRDYITEDGFGVTARGRAYLAPLIQGEDYPPYVDGLPAYVRLKNVAVRKKLAAWQKG